MGRHRRLIAGLLLLALAGCAQPPPFPAVAPLIPPLAAEQARIYFYRDWEVSESVSSWPRIYLNGAPAGAAVPGGVFYRDVPAPETYDISVDTYGVYWYPFKEVADTFVVAIIEPAQAEPELQGMRYVEREAQ
jgi:hypothetical protein